MAASLIVVLLVATADSSPATTQPLTSAAEEVLGPDAIVLVREVPALPSDDAAIALGGALHADAVGELSWRADSVAHMHVHVDAGWEDRDLAFSAADAEAERGRTIGFALASMVPAKSPAPVATPPAAIVSTGSVAPPLAIDARPSTTPRSHGAIDLLGIGAIGIGGNAGGFGGELVGRWRLGALFPLVNVGFRRDDIPSWGLSSTIVRVGGGVAGLFVHNGPLELGARVELLGIHDAVSTSGASGGRWLIGSDASLEGAMWVVDSIAIVASVGGEFAFGTTRVVIAGTDAAVIPRARVIGGIGLRARL